MARRDRNEDDDDKTQDKVDTRKRRSRDDEDDDDDKPTRATSGVSLDDDDAIDVGLFASGPFEVIRSEFATYDYGGTSRNPPIVWLITYKRPGKGGERYEQPYGIGKGWALDKRTGELIAQKGQTGLPKTCNAIKHLVKPLKKALADADIDYPKTMDPGVFVGLTGECERVEQEARNIREGERGRDRDRDRDRDGEKKDPNTILEIREVTSAPWAKGLGSSKSRAKAKNDADDEDDAKPTSKSKPNGKGDTDSDTVLEDAIEALVSVVGSSKDKIRIGDELEEALEKVLKGVKGSGAIIDVATLDKTLKMEKGWSYNGKYVDAE